MKLYTFDPAPNPQRLQLFINYKGIDIDTEQVDMANQAQLSDEFREVNPLCTVPALVTDEGALITEVVAACSYLEALYPERPLMGSTALEKAQVLGEMHKLFNTAFMGIAEAFRNSTPGFKGRALPGPLDVEQIPALAERGQQRLAFAWDALEKALAERDWLVGDKLTQADIDLFVCQGFSGWVKLTPGDEHPNLLAHAGRVKNALGI
ncbi:MAG: glutathione S-transferase family protein [Pseudomonadota bacterium]